jgi:hypothetical protein
MRQRRTGHRRCAIHVGAESVGPGVIRSIDEPREDIDRGGVHEVVQPAPRRDDRVDGADALGFVPHVAFDGEVTIPRCVGHRLRQLFDPAGRECHGGTGGGRLQTDLASDAGGCADHQDPRPGQWFHSRPSLVSRQHLSGHQT